MPNDTTSTTDDKKDPHLICARCTLKELHDWMVYNESLLPPKESRDEFEKEIEKYLEWYKENGGTGALTVTQLCILSTLCQKIAAECGGEEHDPFDAVLAVFLLDPNVWEHLNMDLEAGTFQMTEAGHKLIEAKDIKPPRLKSFPTSERKKKE